MRSGPPERAGTFPESPALFEAAGENPLSRRLGDDGGIHVEPRTRGPRAVLAHAHLRVAASGARTRHKEARWRHQRRISSSSPDGRALERGAALPQLRLAPGLAREESLAEVFREHHAETRSSAASSESVSRPTARRRRASRTRS